MFAGKRRWCWAMVVVVTATALIWAGSAAGAGDKNKSHSTYSGSSKDKGASGATGTSGTMGSTMREQGQFSPKLLYAEPLIGASVVNQQGEKLGDIQDIVLNPQRDQVSYVAVSSGGVMGVGAKHVAVPWSALDIQSAKVDKIDKVTLNVSKSQFDALPTFESGHWPEQGVSQLTNVRGSSYGGAAGGMGSSGQSWQSSQGAAGGTGDTSTPGATPPSTGTGTGAGGSGTGGASSGTSGTSGSMSPSGTSGSLGGASGSISPSGASGSIGGASGSVGSGGASGSVGSGGASGTAGSSGYSGNLSGDTSGSSAGGGATGTIPGGTSGSTDPAWKGSSSSRSGAQGATGETGRTDRYGTDQSLNNMENRGGAASSDMRFRRVSELVGLRVKDYQNNDLGNIDNLVLDLREGRPVYGVIGFGGFLGLGEKVAAVPWTALNIQPRGDIARLNAQKSDLEAIAYDPKNPPDLASMDYAQKLHQRFQQEPYWQVYGYTPPSADMQNRSSQAWNSSSKYNTTFDASQMTTINGTVQSVGSFRPETGAASGQRLQVLGDDGKTYTVHLGPADYAAQKGFTFHYGDKVKVTGSKATVEGNSIVMATQIEKDGKTLDLRDKQGKPMWGEGAAGGTGMSGSSDFEKSGGATSPGSSGTSGSSSSGAGASSGTSGSGSSSGTSGSGSSSSSGSGSGSSSSGY